MVHLATRHPLIYIQESVYQHLRLLVDQHRHGVQVLLDSLVVVVCLRDELAELDAALQELVKLRPVCVQDALLEAGAGLALIRRRQLLQFADDFLHHLEELILREDAREVTGLCQSACKLDEVPKVDQDEQLRVLERFHCELADSLSIAKDVLAPQI